MVGEYCDGISGLDATSVSLSCKMRVGVVVGRDMFVAALCLGCF